MVTLQRALWVAVAALGSGVVASVAAERYAESQRPLVTPAPLALPDLNTSVALARLGAGSLLLREVSEAEVVGVRVEGSPLEAYVAHGLAGLRALRDTGLSERHPLSALLPPVPAAPPHVAAGNNFADHQDEVGLHDAPELFPKLVEATAWGADVPYVGRLDYEVELCAVTLESATAGRAPALGYVLCNDFTDRWRMMAGLDPRQPLGMTGFPDGKGQPGFLPTGPWLVIPEDAAAFASSVSLRLSVNGRLRQDAPQSLAVWDHARILDGALARCGWTYSYGGEARAWPICDTVPAGTLVLGGTPGGVIFRPWNLLAGWKYLSVGDLVVTEGTGLGRIESRVVR